jgi:hypothetical protein
MPIIYDMPDKDYHRDRAVSKSRLWTRHEREGLGEWWQYEEGHKPPETPALHLGSAIHCAVLEPDLFDSKYAVAPECDRRTKIGKETYAEFQLTLAGREAIAQDERDTCLHIAEALRKQQPLIGETLAQDKGHSEVSVFWHDPDTGLECKARPDWLSSNGEVVIDLKTTRDARPREFAKACAEHGYHLQNAWYMRGLQWARGKDGLLPKHFVFAAVEKEPPYLCALYELDALSVSFGWSECRRLLNLIAESKRTGIWPGLSQDVQTLSLPKWAMGA